MIFSTDFGVVGALQAVPDSKFTNASNHFGPAFCVRVDLAGAQHAAPRLRSGKQSKSLLDTIE
jgi:hypothetical protein